MGRFINGDAYATTGQGLLSNNMFAYCGNNIINFDDDSGARMVPYYDHGYGAVTVHEELTAEGTASVGITFSLGTGIWAYFAQLSQVTDLQDNSELQLTLGAGLSPGKGTSIAGSMTFTNAPNVTFLHGMGYQIGVTYAGVGCDLVFIPDPDNPNSAYSGFSAIIGTPSTDVHYSMGYTIPLYPNSFNLIDFFDTVYRSYWGIN